MKKIVDTKKYFLYFIAMQNIVEIIAKDCISCGACVVICPCEAIKLKGGAVLDEEKCIGCGMCITKCYMRCIIWKRESNEQ